MDKQKILSEEVIPNMIAVKTKLTEQVIKELHKAGLQVRELFIPLRYRGLKYQSAIIQGEVALAKYILSNHGIRYSLCVRG